MLTFYILLHTSFSHSANNVPKQAEAKNQIGKSKGSSGFKQNLNQTE
jgi:hypothetical protein